jgi:hypothetical protein
MEASKESLIIMRLTEEEAGILLDLFDRISGSIECPGRCVTHNLSVLLRKAGVEPIDAFTADDEIEAKPLIAIAEPQSTTL